MRVAFLVHDFPSLSETFIINQATGLIDRGHEVDIYTNRVHHNAKMHPDVMKYGLLERTRTLLPIPSSLLMRVLIGISLFITHFYRNPALFLRSLNIFRYGLGALALRRVYVAAVLADKPAYDIVHCQFGTQWSNGMTFCELFRPKAKLIVMFRGYDISSYVQERGEHIYDAVFRKGDFFLANCDFFRQRAIKLGCDSNKIAVHRSGLDCGKFPYIARHPRPERGVSIATTGRLVEKKGIEYVIRAIAQLLPIYPTLQYNIIGDGILKPKLQQLIDELEVGHAVHLLGWKNEQEITEILKDTDVFVAPSVTAEDGNQDAPTNVLKEAMAMGLPVIGTWHGGIPELVKDGINGFLVPERDVAALADRLSYLIQHPESWEPLGRSGRATIETQYNLDTLNERLVDLYQGLHSATDAARVTPPVFATKPTTAQAPTT
ncbi:MULTISPECIES: glycosyltransferase [unclassified Leptolyngbya]|uniref:glycosyltransferase n=1 Tax=unclassified Leptolyngbya TaxID=2650499 RepID=UPI001688D105|nr:MULTISPECIES: glycosyltransferase [unclassified Leptolyngbya]MBD1914251.1 glycosyltransferase [Leptolyngbya sp. FACHB-8]MBD2157258.1 glycosyltransferase [Leptolyngbya sp. FACHB-16]